MMTPLRGLAAMVAAAMVVLTSTPADAWSVGSSVCRSYHEGVTTLQATEIYKRCFPDCLISLVPTHSSARSAVIDYYEPGYEGPVHVAIISNDSRLGPRMIGAPKRLGTLPHPGGLTNWRLSFGGLQPEHYYAMVIYGSDPARPFYRACFLSDDAPDSP